MNGTCAQGREATCHHTLSILGTLLSELFLEIPPLVGELPKVPSLKVRVTINFLPLDWKIA